MEIASLQELHAGLMQVQAQRVPEVRCTLTPSFAVRITQAQLHAAFDAALTLAQGRTWQMKRLRGGAAVLISRLTWRDGLRMLEGRLPVPELARAIVREAVQRFPSPMERFCWLYALVCTGVRYVHTAPGEKGYAQLVGASGVLTSGCGNCQGFADTLYLLCRLAGLEAEIRVGPGERGLHAWNAVCLEGETYLSDASRGSRAHRSEGLPGMLRTCLMDDSGAPVCPETQCIQKIAASACDFFHDFAGKSENPPFPKPQDVV